MSQNNITGQHCWVRSKNATSALCSHPSLDLKLKWIDRTHYFVVETFQLLLQTILGRRFLRKSAILTAEATKQVDSCAI